MRIVDSSAKIIPKQGHLEQIARFGATAYQTEEVKGGALAFFKRMRDIRHDSVLEGSVITIKIQFGSLVSMEEFLATDRKYLNVTRESYRIITITANIRAWREWILENQSEFGGLILSIEDALSEGEAFMLFDDIPPINSLPDDSLMSVRVVSREEVESFSPKKRAKHLFVMVEFIVNRAVSHQLVRSRPCSFLQESQRYCRYLDDRFGKEVTFIRPSAFLPIGAEPCSIMCGDDAGGMCYLCGITPDSDEIKQYREWAKAMRCAEKSYFKMLRNNAPPQLARLVLGNSCKTVLMVYANLEEWRHIFSLRTTKHADPSMREVMIPLQKEFELRGWT